MKIQDDPKKQSYIGLLEHYNINLKSNDYIYKYHDLRLGKAKTHYQPSKRIL